MVSPTDTDFIYLYGGAGNDTLSTGSGGGYLFGEGGANTLTGGGGINVCGRRRFRHRHHERQQRLLHRCKLDRARRRYLQDGA
jgi:hypothetical protein